MAVAAPFIAGEAIEKAAAGAGKALTADLLVLRKTYNAGTAKRPEPVEAELHVNAIGLLLGAAAVGVGLIVWDGLTIHSGLGNETTLLGGLKGRVGKKNQQTQQAPGGIVDSIVSVIQGTILSPVAGTGTALGRILSSR